MAKTRSGTTRSGIKSTIVMRPKSPPVNASHSGTISPTNALEKKRLENLKRNATLMENLGLARLCMNEVKTPPKRRKSSPKTARKNSEPKRKSSRLEIQQEKGAKIDYSSKHIQLDTFFDEDQLDALPTRKRLTQVTDVSEITDATEDEQAYWKKLSKVPVLHQSFRGDPAAAARGNWALVAAGHAAGGFFGRLERGHAKASGAKVYYAPYSTTCHWCRQKTVDLKTKCSACHEHFADGVLCGACLYNRYDENILDALEDKEWLCPCCTDECNCSFCLPGRKKVKCTGQMSKVVAAEGLTVNQWLVRHKGVRFGCPGLVHPAVKARAAARGQDVGAFLAAYHAARGTARGRAGAGAAAAAAAPGGAAAAPGAAAAAPAP